MLGIILTVLAASLIIMSVRREAGAVSPEKVK